MHKKSNSNHTISIKYAIQIASWPSLDEARTHKLELLQEGFDAYIERYYSKKKNEVWYRVRLGNFSNKNQAMKLKKKIESSKNFLNTCSSTFSISTSSVEISKWSAHLNKTPLDNKLSSFDCSSVIPA